MRIQALKAVSATILAEFIKILIDFIKKGFKKKLNQLCPYTDDINSFVLHNTTPLSQVSAHNYIKFMKGTEDITIFNYYGELAFDAYCANPQEVINRNNFVKFFKQNYYGKAIFIFSLKWFFIAFYRYYQIFVNREYICLDTKIKNNELFYWNYGNEKYKVEEYIYPKYVRILYVLIFDLSSFIYGVFFLKNLQKTEWNHIIVYAIQIVEYAFLIVLFCLSLLNFNKCINSQTDEHLFFKNNNVYDIIFIILDLFENYIK